MRVREPLAVHSVERGSYDEDGDDVLFEQHVGDFTKVFEKLFGTVSRPAVAVQISVVLLQVIDARAKGAT